MALEYIIGFIVSLVDLGLLALCAALAREILDWQLMQEISR